MVLSGQQVPERSGGLIPQDVSLPFDPSVRSLKPPSFLDGARASLTSRDSASASTSNCGSGGGGLSLRERRVPKRRGGLIHQDRSIPFEMSVRSPKPPSCLDIARASLTTITRARTSTSHCGSGGGEVSPSGHQVPKKSGGLLSQHESLPFDPSARSPKPPSYLERARYSLITSGSARSKTSHGDSGGGEVSLRGQQSPNQSGALFPQDGSLTLKLSAISPKPPY